MIAKIRLQNFKAHLDTTVPLGRLTMLVGDNASGKTSVLEALSLLTMLGPKPHLALQNDFAPMDLIRRDAKSKLRISAEGPGLSQSRHSPWGLSFELAPTVDDYWNADLATDLPNGPSNADYVFSCDEARLSTAPAGQVLWVNLEDAFKQSRVYSLDAKAIAAGAFDAGHTNRWMDERGTNATSVLANMKLERDDDFEQVEEALRRIVPTVRRVRLKPVRHPMGDGHKIYFDFRGASGVPAHGASHGTLITLALLTVLYGQQRPDLLLLDDFDHALHPRAQLELVKMLKELLALDDFANLQIVATTHSPYVLDELEVEDVQVFALRDDVVVVTKSLAEHPDAASTRGMVSAGQLWSMDPERDWVIGG